MTKKTFRQLPAEAQEIIRALTRVCETACGVATKERVFREIKAETLSAPFPVHEPTIEDLKNLNKSALQAIQMVTEQYGVIGDKGQE